MNRQGFAILSDTHEYRLELYPEQYGDAYEKYVAGLKAAGIDPLINQNTDLPVYNIARPPFPVQTCRRHTSEKGLNWGTVHRPAPAGA